MTVDQLKGAERLGTAPEVTRSTTAIRASRSARGLPFRRQPRHKIKDASENPCLPAELLPSSSGPGLKERLQAKEINAFPGVGAKPVPVRISY
jgi:hypothetical protein